MSYDNSESRYFSTVNRIRSSSRDDSLDNRSCYQTHHRYRRALDVMDEVKRINDIIDVMVADIDRKVDDIDGKVDAYLDDVFGDDNDGEKMSKKSKGKRKKKEKKDDSKVDDFGQRMRKLYKLHYGTTKPVVKTYDGKKHDDENDVKDIEMNDTNDDLRNIEDYNKLRHGSLSQRIFVALTGSDDDEDGEFWDENGELRHRWSPARCVAVCDHNGINLMETIEAWLIVLCMTVAIMSLLFLCFALFAQMPIGTWFQTVGVFTLLLAPVVVIFILAYDEKFKKTQVVAGCAFLFLAVAAIGGYFNVSSAYSPGVPVETSRSEITTKVDGDTFYVNGDINVLADGVQEVSLIDYLDDRTSLGIGSKIEDDEIEVRIDDKAKEPYVTTEQTPSEFHADRLSVFGEIANSIAHYGNDDGINEPVLYLPEGMKVSFDVP